MRPEGVTGTLGRRAFGSASLSFKVLAPAASNSSLGLDYVGPRTRRHSSIVAVRG